MKNKALKNLIALGVFALAIFSVNSAQASLYYDAPVYDSSANYYNYRNNNYYSPRQQIVEQQLSFQKRQLQLESQLSQQQYYNDQQKLIQEHNLALQKQALATNTVYTGATYNPQPVLVNNTASQNYVSQQKQIEYVPSQPINYIPASAQGASAYNSVYTKKVNTTTGQYVNYDPNLQAASAYGYGNVQQVGQVDPNGVTALSMNGSGSFMPSSVFQWFMFILLMLAIIIVARLIIRKRAANNAHAAPAH